MFSTNDNDPPSYKDAISEPKEISKAARILEPVALATPLVVAIILLYLSTGSGDSWRADLGVLTIALEGSEYQSLLRMTSMAKRSVAGTLSIGPWGWCVTSSHNDHNTCSQSSAWFDMRPVLSESLANAVGSTLTRGLFVHFLALVSSMLAAAPVLMNVYKRYYKNDPKVEAGWFQHGTLFGAFVLATAAWVIDVLLRNSAVRVLKERARAGPGQALAGVSALFLLSSLLLSSIPVLRRHFKTQNQELKNWQHVEALGPALEKEVEAYMDRDMERKGHRDKEGKGHKGKERKDPEGKRHRHGRPWRRHY